jgi:hypothetical protein
LTTAHKLNNIPENFVGDFMKFVLTFLLMVLSTTVTAAPNKLGVGAMIGNPTGLNGKYWLEGNRAVDGGLAFSFTKGAYLGIHSDYLIHNDAAFYFNDVYPLDLYYGIGGRMLFGDGLDLGIRVPVGVAHQFKQQPADVFAEIAPIVDFISRTGFDLHFAIGARLYF